MIKFSLIEEGVDFKNKKVYSGEHLENIRGEYMNFLHIAGHLGADPEVRFTSSGKKVITLRVACRGRKEETIWWKATIWGEEFDKMLQYFKKGSSIVVTGEMMKPEIYNDREGKPQISMQMTAHHIAFSPFGKPKSNSDEGQMGSNTMNQFAMDPAPAAQKPEAASGAFQESGFSDDEIPF